MNDAELIATVRSIRKFVIILDSIGFPIKDIVSDKELSKLVSKDLPKKIKSVASEIHNTLQKIENSKQYKDAVYKMCSVSERTTFTLDGDDNG